MYIGQSVDIERRLKQHKNCLTSNNHPNNHLQNSVNKYGISHFRFNTLEKCEKADLNRNEKKYIKLFDSYKNGYNATEGGEDTPFSNPKIHKKGCKSKLMRKKRRKDNKSGYYRVYLDKNTSCTQGFVYRYNYKENGKNTSMAATKIEKLEQKVKEKGLPWKKFT